MARVVSFGEPQRGRVVLGSASDGFSVKRRRNSFDGNAPTGASPESPSRPSSADAREAAHLRQLMPPPPAPTFKRVRRPQAAGLQPPGTATTSTPASSSRSPRSALLRSGSGSPPPTERLPAELVPASVAAAGRPWERTRHQGQNGPKGRGKSKDKRRDAKEPEKGRRRRPDMKANEDEEQQHVIVVDQQPLPQDEEQQHVIVVDQQPLPQEVSSGALLSLQPARAHSGKELRHHQEAEQQSLPLPALAPKPHSQQKQHQHPKGSHHQKGAGKNQRGRGKGKPGGLEAPSEKTSSCTSNATAKSGSRRGRGGGASSRKFSSELEKTSSLEDLLNLVESRCTRFSLSETASAMLKAIRLAGDGGVSQLQAEMRFQELRVRLKTLLGLTPLPPAQRPPPEDLAEAACAISRLPPVDLELMKRLATEATPGFAEAPGSARGFTPTSAGRLLAAIARAGLRLPTVLLCAAKAVASMDLSGDEDVVVVEPEAAVKEEVLESSSGTSQAIAALAASFAAGWEAKGSQTLPRAAPANSDGGEDLAQLSWAFATCSWADEAVFARITVAARQRGLATMSPASVARLAWSLSFVGLPDVQFCAEAAREALSRWPDFGLQQIVNLAWALAQAGPCPGAPPNLADSSSMSAAEAARAAFFAALAGRLGAAELSRLQVAEVADAAWAAARAAPAAGLAGRAAERAAAVEFVYRCARAAAGLASELAQRPAAVSRLCWACARLGISDEDLLGSLEDEVALVAMEHGFD